MLYITSTLTGFLLMNDESLASPQKGIILSCIGKTGVINDTIHHTKKWHNKSDDLFWIIVYSFKTLISKVKINIYCATLDIL